MTAYGNSHPSFYDNDQLIVRVGCDGNIFNLSSLKEFEHQMTSRCFAIKFVCDGTERYTIHNKSYKVTSGSYLLLNGEKEGRVLIDSDRYVKGMCLNVSNELIAGIVSSHCAPDTAVPDPELAAFFYTDRFLENQYVASHTHLGRKLQEISHQVHTSSFSSDQINQELFYRLAEALVADQVIVFRQLQSVRTVKSATKRELCRQVLRGKEFIDSHFNEACTIARIAGTAGMSEYHFFRLFKQIIGSTPYQYMLSKRLQASSELLKADYSVSDTAIATGFSDIHSFSKAFKKHFGVSPTGHASKAF